MMDDVDLLEVICRVHCETDKAYGIKVEDDGFGWEAEVIFVPKSECEVTPEGMLIPEWLVSEKGLEDYVR